MHISMKSAAWMGALALVAPALVGGASQAATVTTASLTAQHPAMRQVLQYGSQGHWVMTLQADLALLGYTQVGPMDGMFGPKTEGALKAFQQRHGFTATGVTSPAVWQDILSGFGLMPPYQGTAPVAITTHSADAMASLMAQHPAMRQVLQYGSQGHWVMTLQADLALLGYSQVGPMDGIFGAKTVVALKAFQQRHGFTATGVTSPAVWQDILSGFGLVPPYQGSDPIATTTAGNSGPATTQTTTTGSITPTTTTTSTAPSVPAGPVLPAKFPTGGPAVEEPSLPSASAGVRGQFTPSTKTIDGRPVLKAYHMVATAYGPSLADNYPYGPVDAFGQPLEDGMVAVDPSVIPLHSVVYVTGYQDNYLPSGGFLGQAMDTGGAIKGDRVDIFINASPTVVGDFGVQQVTIYVLGQ